MQLINKLKINAYFNLDYIEEKTYCTWVTLKIRWYSNAEHHKKRSIYKN